jgi:ubiquinone/menaquinone biosynthesis C-methylase UbiE
MKRERIYSLWAPIYDRLWERVFLKPRRRAIELLILAPGENLLISGIGTGQDIPHLPQGIRVTGIDLNADMLAHARRKICERPIDLLQMDVQQLEFPTGAYDAVLCNLILSVVPDGRRAFTEAWRVLKPGGRLVIFDKFIPEGARLTFLRQVIGTFLTLLGTDPNRRLVDIIGDTKDSIILIDEPSILNGQYRIIKLEKAGPVPAKRE